MVRQGKTTLALGLLALCVGVFVLLQALLLGFHIEGTPRALADSAKGQRIAVPAVVAVATGIAAIVGRSRRWGLVVACIAAAAAVVAVLLTVIIPGG